MLCCSCFNDHPFKTLCGPFVHDTLEDVQYQQVSSFLSCYYCQKTSDETVANMEKLHSEALAAKEAEMSARINQAVVCARVARFV